jgi:hydroxymethylglutaryl-CoA lyase
MRPFPQRVDVYEVGPRDGLQNEPAPVATEVKVELVNRLAAAGLPYVEVSSFVHPRWIPQLGDAEDVFAQIERRPGVRYGALVPNMRGLSRARDVGLVDIALFISSSEAHNKRNLNRSIDESFAEIEGVLAELEGSESWIRAYVSMVFGCPYEGDVAIDRIKGVVDRLLSAGVDQISLGDTVGLASPASVSTVVEALTTEAPRWPMWWRVSTPGSPSSMRPSADSVAAPTRRGPPVTSPPKTSSRCCTPWESRRVSTSKP